MAEDERASDKAAPPHGAENVPASSPLGGGGRRSNGWDVGPDE